EAFPAASELQPRAAKLLQPPNNGQTAPEPLEHHVRDRLKPVTRILVRQPAVCGPEVRRAGCRFRPPLRPTFRFRVVPPGEASSYSRPVLGASGTLRPPRRRRKREGNRNRAQIARSGGHWERIAV